MTIYDVLRAENEKTLALLRKLEETSRERPEARERILRQARIQLESVIRIEEQVFYPLFTGDGAAWAEASISRQENREITGLMRDLVTMDPSGQGFRHTAEKLHSQVRQHVRRQEQRLFPMAVRVVPSSRAQASTDKMQQLELELERAAELRAQI